MTGRGWHKRANERVIANEAGDELRTWNEVEEKENLVNMCPGAFAENNFIYNF